MSLQIIVSSVNGHSLCLSTENAYSLESLHNEIYRLEGINPEDQRIIYNGHEIDENDKFIQVVSQKIEFIPVQFLLRGGCSGGKGGFGSLLRSAKSVKKTTNFGSCRDLNGRRLRDVENERRLTNWREQEIEKEEEKETYIERKTIKTEMREEGLNKTRKSIVDNVDMSVKKGLLLYNKRKEEEKRKRKRDEKYIQESDPSSSDEDEPRKKKKRIDKSQTKKLSPTFGDDTSTSSDETTTTTSCDERNNITVNDSTTSQTQGIKQPLEESDPIDLSCYNSALELEALGLEALKLELTRLGLKIGGNLKQRAERLWVTKGLTADQYPPTIKVVNTKAKRRNF